MKIQSFMLICRRRLILDDRIRMQMTQNPPEIFVNFLLYGDVKGKGFDSPETQITKELGLEPSEASCEDGVLIWEFKLPKEKTWELPELLSDMLEKFDAKKVRRCLEKYVIEAEVKAAVYITDSYPCLFFPPSLMKKIADLGAGFDLDCYRTAYPENKDVI